MFFAASPALTGGPGTQQALKRGQQKEGGKKGKEREKKKGRHERRRKTTER